MTTPSAFVTVVVTVPFALVTTVVVVPVLDDEPLPPAAPVPLAPGDGAPLVEEVSVAAGV
jgi:hypothetical protein